MLSDPEKRKIYDKYGEEGMSAGGGGGSGMDIFEMFGMGGGRRQQQSGPKKVKPTGKQLEVTLEDLYNGKHAEFEIERHRICAKCNGIGGTDASAV